MSFLKAGWEQLIMANYLVDPAVLEKYVPPGTSLDSYNGKCFVSLVGFMFLNTRVLGMKIPFHVNFEEVNLRFYVRREERKKTDSGVEKITKRGVVFIKEIVPKYAITFVANTVYKENYETMKMDHIWTENEVERSTQYRWRKGKQWHSIAVKADVQSVPIAKNSEPEFIAEHYWGYAQVDSTTSYEYEVTHPKWELYPVSGFAIDVDFGAVYGSEFTFLNEQKPDSVILAKGSPITVEGKRKIY